MVLVIHGFGVFSIISTQKSGVALWSDILHTETFFTVTVIDIIPCALNECTRDYIYYGKCSLHFDPKKLFIQLMCMNC